MPDQPQPAVIPVPAVEPAEPIEPAERTALIHPDRHAIIRRLLTALRSHLHRHQALFIGSLAGGGMLVAGFCSVAQYSAQPVRLAAITNHQHNQPIVISFSRTIHKDVKYRITEDIGGEWQVDRTLGGIKELVFKPAAALAPGTVLHAEITNVRPLLGLGDGTPSDQSLLIVVQRAPVVTATTPQADAANVLPKTAISLQLSGQNRGLRAIRLTNTNLPLTSDQPASTDDTTFAWALSAPLEQGKKYTGTVIDTNQPDGKQLLATYNFTTVAAPNVSSQHNGFLVPNSAIDITFDQDMVAAASVVATDIPGNGTWTDTRTYRFTAGAVQPGKTYVYTVPAGLQSAAGGTTPADRSFSVKTPGPVRVLSVRPTGSRAALSSTVSVTFDQPVNHASAEAAFAILPAAAGSFGWSGNTMTFKPQGLHYQTTYTVTVAAGITPDFGLPGLAHSDSFMTTYEIKKLAVPFYRQAHALSCESASLRMALGHYGVHVVDDTVMALVGGSKGPRDTATNTWDDPYLTFVGNVDGRMGTTGWGVYSGPIAAAATSLGRQATAIGGGVTPAQVAAAIHAGNPVVLWGISGSVAREDSWNTTTSGVVRAPRNEHVRVVYGVEGSASDPVGFYLYDPLGSAAGLHWTTAQLRSNSAAGGGHAVIVR